MPNHLQVIKARRLKVGDEVLAVRAIETLIWPEERDNQIASLEHMRKLLSHTDHYLIVACSGQQPLGFLLAYLFLRADRDASMVYLYDICVDPAHRRQGVATKMLDLLKKLCCDQNVHHIWVGTSDSNAEARAFYETTGAQEVSDNYVEFVYPRQNLT